MVPCPLQPFVELVDRRGADDGQREEGFGAVPGADADGLPEMAVSGGRLCVIEWVGWGLSRIS